MRLLRVQPPLLGHKLSCDPGHTFKTKRAGGRGVVTTSNALTNDALVTGIQQREYVSPSAAYIHLPFCKKKCYYCDFPVIAMGGGGEKMKDAMETYVDAVCEEIIQTQTQSKEKKEKGKDDRHSSSALTSVFFGGGTPSLTPPHLLERLLKTLDRTYGISPTAEVSIEADPGTFTTTDLRYYRSTLGINRISMGVQSFDDSLLLACGRSHSLRDVMRAIESVYAADVTNWSMDLISGLPGLTEDIWTSTLRTALDASPHHISIYDLQIEDGTPFGKKYRPGVAPLPTDDAAACMFEFASLLLGGTGYEHYEISNYALPGHRCRHNMTYWEGRPYLAFGMGAASYLDGRRFSRPRRLASYLRWVYEQNCVPEGDNVQQDAKEKCRDMVYDTVMLRLRLADGLDLAQLGNLGIGQWHKIEDVVMDALKVHQEEGMVEIMSETRIRLTDPKGFLMSNDIISDIFAALERRAVESQ
jgi:putative oxygen-independent coproporphyrinogen III oxidase